MLYSYCYVFFFLFSLRESIILNKILILEYFLIYRKLWSYTECFHTPHTQFPLLLTSYISMIHLSQGMSQYWYIIIK
jgi:hypothetical protein